MSERVDRKLIEVPIVRYGYRHEAEFASGFLEEAGIPYRLQVEDATLGVAASTSATIWVREMDVRKAQDLLELGDGKPGVRLTTDRSQPARRASAVQRSEGGPGDGTWPRLVGAERALGAVGGAGLVVGAQLVTATVPLLVPAMTAVGAVLLMPALLGRAPRWLKNLLAGLTGGAP